MYNKKIISTLLAVVMSASLVMPASITSYADDIVDISAQTYDAQESEQKRGTGYIELDDDVRAVPGVLQPDISDSHSQYSADREVVYPAYYKTASLPAVRDQKSYGVCWAFATMSLVEINLLKKKLVTDDIDLSELHLINYTYNCVNDKLGGLDGDSNKFIGKSIMQMGGNVELAANSLEDWEGAVKETVLPLNDENVKKVENNQLGDSLAYSDTYAHVQNFYKINTSSANDIKRAIMEYGAVSASYCSDSSFDKSTTYYNSTTAAYYCNQNYSTNHAITIVGWDDDFLADNFSTKPDGNGAWIVRNSWGSRYGKEGYFYLSYYDKSLSDIAYALEADLYDNYDNNYQYDGTMQHSGASIGTTGKFANVFTAKANSGGYENIKAVSFETYSSDCQNPSVDYKIYVYTKLTDVSNPESGSLVAQKEGTTTYAGMYTINLDKEVNIEQGELFSVVVELTGKNGVSPWIARDHSQTVENWFSCTSSAKENQSFYSTSYGNWYDYGSSYSANFIIKAFTDNTSQQNVINVERISLNKDNLTLEEGSKEQLKATITPSDATYRNVTWTSSNDSVASVDNSGNVTAKSIGTAVITATTKDGKSVDCTVTVKKKEIAIEYIYLNYGSLSIQKGKSVRITAIIGPDNTTYSKTVKWSSSNESVATVDSDGNVKAIAAGKTTITAETVNGKIASCSISVYENPITGITLSDSTITLKEGYSYRINANVSPSDTSDDKTLTWTSSNPSIANVDSDGNVTAKKAGTAVITATSVNGVTAQCQVMVSGAFTRFLENETANSIMTKYRRMGYSAIIVAPDGRYLRNNDIVFTGCNLKYMYISGSSEKFLSGVYVAGDANGDGSVSVLDMEAIQKDILGISKLEGAYKMAAKLTERSDEISVLDMEVIQKHILGIEKIK